MAIGLIEPGTNDCGSKIMRQREKEGGGSGRKGRERDQKKEAKSSEKGEEENHILLG